MRKQGKRNPQRPLSPGTDPGEFAEYSMGTLCEVEGAMFFNEAVSKGPDRYRVLHRLIPFMVSVSVANRQMHRSSAF